MCRDDLEGGWASVWFDHQLLAPVEEHLRRCGAKRTGPFFLYRLWLTLWDDDLRDWSLEGSRIVIDSGPFGTTSGYELRVPKDRVAVRDAVAELLVSQHGARRASLP